MLTMLFKVSIRDRSRSNVGSCIKFFGGECAAFEGDEEEAPGDELGYGNGEGECKLCGIYDDNKCTRLRACVSAVLKSSAQYRLIS